ncbi:MAG: Rab family GTPase, partial [Dokdonella sp.]|uniref:Rab family GTPase n=1 Tax=Dokdonella sp. TaxID=2291710 RepID=UPI003265691D
GKTSLVARFVRSTFSDKYLTTVGVKVDSKEVVLRGRGAQKLVVWDIAGRSALDALGAHYLRGASALMLVADGTREASLSSALNLLMQSRQLLPNAHAVLLVNKIDLVERWEVAPTTLAQLRRSLPVFETSALSGDGVEEAFADVAARLAT